MSEFLKAALVLFVLLGSSVLGLVAHPLFSERHRGRKLTEFVALVLLLQVTFAALVLGLLTTSVEASYDKVGADLNAISIDLIQLDQCLHEWGEEAVPIRKIMRNYFAARIATTWTEEPKPPGDYDPTKLPTIHGTQLETVVLDEMLTRVEFGIRELEPRNLMQRRLETPAFRNTSGSCRRAGN